MAQVVIAVGSNLGDRLDALRKAGLFLDRISESPVQKSSVWESEPVGPAKYRFLNSAALISTTVPPDELLSTLKDFELTLGRRPGTERWGPRILDLDIISYNHLVIHSDTLIIPHPEYHNRLFVLLPMLELLPDWLDQNRGMQIEAMIEAAPGIDIMKTDFTW